MKSIIYSGQQVAHQCSIEGSSFDDVNLQKSFFNNVNLQQSVFSTINLEHSTFYDMNLSGSTFSYVNLGGVQFNNISTTSINHLGKSLNNPLRFEDSDLSACVMNNVDLSGAVLNNCNIEGLIINGVDIAALLNTQTAKPAIQAIGWCTQNTSGKLNKTSKIHYAFVGDSKTLCGVKIPSQDKVTVLSADSGKGECKRCLAIKSINEK